MRPYHAQTSDERSRTGAEDARLRSVGHSRPTIREWYGFGALPAAATWAWDIEGRPIRGDEPCPISPDRIREQVLIGAEWAAAGTPVQDLAATLGGRPRPWGQAAFAA